MNNKRLIQLLLTGAILLLGMACTEQNAVDKGNSGLDYSHLAQVTLGRIDLAQDVTETRAVAGTTPMKVGSSFRLYAFEKGKTDMNDLLATRTYSIDQMEGVPVLSANEDLLYLPKGEIDIYLVGPLSAEIGPFVNQADTTKRWVEVATSEGVKPHYGVDLIASKSTIDVKDEDHFQFSAEPLQHKMAKMQVRISKPQSSAYTNFNVTKIKVSQQALTSTYQFGADGGTIEPVGEGTEEIEYFDERIETLVSGEQYQSTDYMLPRNEAQMVISVNFTATNGAGANIEKRLNSGTMNNELVAGRINRFSADVVISADVLFRWRLLPWNTANQDEEELGVADQFLFSYSGEDEPIVKAGKRYWRDRSGHGNDAELIGDIRYNKEGKYYYQGDEDAYILVPKLGYVAPYTFEATCSTALNESKDCELLFFRNKEADTDHGLYVCLPGKDSKVYYDAGGTTSTTRTSVNFAPNEPFLYKNIATWAFRNNAGATAIYRNGTSLTTQTGMTTAYDSLNYNQIFYQNCENVKLYAVRMIKKSLPETSTTGGGTIRMNAANDLTTFTGINTDADPANRDYIKDGLILDLRGTDGQTSTKLGTDNFSYWWKDRSGYANHAGISKTGMYVAASKGFKFNSGYMKLDKSLGSHQSFTIQVVAIAGANNGETLMNFGHLSGGGDKSRQFSLHYPWRANLVVYSPYYGYGIDLDLSKMVSQKYIPTEANLKAKPNQLTITREGGNKQGILLWVNDTPIDFTGSTGPNGNSAESLLNPMTYCYLGANSVSSAGALGQPSTSTICAVRFYNRILTEEELRFNYEVDKYKYNIIP